MRFPLRSGEGLRVLTIDAVLPSSVMTVCLELSVKVDLAPFLTRATEGDCRGSDLARFSL